MRDVVRSFGDAMEHKLRKHDGDRTWRDGSCSQSDLLRGLRGEVCELAAVLAHRPARPDAIRDEAADVANFAMMIADLAGGLPPAMPEPPPPPAPPTRTRLPDERRAVTHHFEMRTADGTLNVYATVGLYDDGRPGELFLRVGGADAERYAGLADAFAIVLSMLLQHGIDLGMVVAKLRGTRAQPTGRVGDRLDASLLDVLARWLGERFPTKETA